ncbi:MAG: acetyl-CoA carboxylase biotin carboxylase subunit [bacterium]|nr:acetyl-CoA carboxylase biotin carboxylase subunit [bacterium]
MGRTKITKVLVANRGEIAVRVIQGLREMGIRAVAVHSDVDRTALHVMTADEAYPIGPAPAAESYLRGDRLIATALACGADAVHPGYGFLSENAAFARACGEAGLIFIGPRPETIELMGNKLAARSRMLASGVPVIPGTETALRDPAAAAAAAREIGYPVLLKAAAGGGGKGMRVVREEADLAAALRRTMGEAGSAFGDDAVFLERYVEEPKHIEVQVLGDGRGGAVHLFERECSVQRRHQKVIEESPSPSLTPELRERICEAAVRTAAAVDYLGAGTVEFILSPQREFFFLEMNTRLQVEHPITEMVTGTDLVRAQIRIARGQGLPYRQQDLRQRGWAIEFRIYAEDPARNFMPAIGRISSHVTPTGPGVRVDSGIYEGFDVPVHYDPLLAKLVVWGEDRAQAIARGRRALQEFTLHGPGHNIPFHLWALERPKFLDGTYTTNFIDERFDPAEFQDPLPDDDRAALLTAAALYEARRRELAGPAPGNADAGAGDGNWRRSALRAMTNHR